MPPVLGPLYHILMLNACKKCLTLRRMTDIKHQIFQELAALEDTVAKVRSAATSASKQTDLEVAILTQQVKTMRDRNAAAMDLINQSMSILKKLK